jgi:hypothetical protein
MDTKIQMAGKAQRIAWKRAAMDLSGQYHLGACLQFIADHHLQQPAAQCVQQYFDDTDHIVQDANVISLMSHVLTGAQDATPLVWDDLAADWSYDDSAVDTRGVSTYKLKKLISPRVASCEGTMPDLDWEPVIYTPRRVVGRKRHREMEETKDAVMDRPTRLRARHLWRVEWENVHRPGHELEQWVRDAVTTDVRRITLLVGGSMLVEFKRTWNEYSHTGHSHIDNYEAAHPSPLGSRPPTVRVTRRRLLECRWCLDQFTDDDLVDHCTSQHPTINDIAEIRLQFDLVPAEDYDFKVYADAIALGFLRRLSFYAETELDTGFSMTLPQRMFASILLVDGVSIERSLHRDLDEYTVTVRDPRILDAVLGQNWWWKQVEDTNGNWNRAFVRFGSRQVPTPDFGKHHCNFVVSVMPVSSVSVYQNSIRV